MMPENSHILQKLKKLLTLANEGIGGEKVNARERLETLMRKHGVSLEELGEEKREIQWFRPARGHFEKKLLYQVMAAVCGIRSTWSHPKRKGQIGLEITTAEHIEIDLRYSAYLAGLKTEMDVCYRAFVHTNKIFHPDAPKSDSPMDDEEMVRLGMAMLGMTPVKIHQALPTPSA